MHSRYADTSIIVNIFLMAEHAVLSVVCQRMFLTDGKYDT
jgi:hypothetical protein